MVKSHFKVYWISHLKDVKDIAQSVNMSLSGFVKQCIIFYLYKNPPKKMKKEFKQKLEVMIAEEKLQNIKGVYTVDRLYNSLMFFPYNQAMQFKKILIAETFNNDYVKKKIKSWKIYLRNFRMDKTKRKVIQLLNDLKKIGYDQSLTRDMRIKKVNMFMEFYYPDLSQNERKDYLNSDMIK